MTDDWRVADSDALKQILGGWTPSPAPSANWLGVALPNRRLPGLSPGKEPQPSADPTNPTLFVGGYTVRLPKTVGDFENAVPARWGTLYVAFMGDMGVGDGYHMLAIASLLAELAAKSVPGRFFDAENAVPKPEGDFPPWHVVTLAVPFNATL
jgi:hypothetical protein